MYELRQNARCIETTSLNYCHRSSLSRHTLYSAPTSIFKPSDTTRSDMSLELDHDCPTCSNDTFWRTASTTLHLGEKTKWVCTECDYGLVRIDGIDSSEH